MLAVVVPKVSLVRAQEVCVQEPNPGPRGDQGMHVVFLPSYHLRGAAGND